MKTSPPDLVESNLPALTREPGWEGRQPDRDHPESFVGCLARDDATAYPSGEPQGFGEVVIIAYLGDLEAVVGTDRHGEIMEKQPLFMVQVPGRRGRYTERYGFRLTEVRPPSRPLDMPAYPDLAYDPDPRSPLHNPWLWLRDNDYVGLLLAFWRSVGQAEGGAPGTWGSRPGFSGRNTDRKR